MIEPRRFEEILKKSFQKALRDPLVFTVYAGWGVTGWGELTKALVTVVSPDFEEMDEGRRQELVWERVLADLSDEEQAQIEFIFTKAPSERQAVQAVGSDRPGDHG